MRRILLSGLFALGIFASATAPAAAKDTYSFFGPLEVQIIGSGGDMREFVALTSDDRHGAAALVTELTSGMQGQGRAVDPTPPLLPHYRIGVGHLGLNSPTMPWSRDSTISFDYYPGGDGPSFLFERFSPNGDVWLARSIEPSPQVAAMIERHLEGLEPISNTAPRGGGNLWSLVIGALLLAIVVGVLVEDRRRWRRDREEAPVKGT